MSQHIKTIKVSPHLILGALGERPPISKCWMRELGLRGQVFAKGHIAGKLLSGPSHPAVGFSFYIPSPGQNASWWKEKQEGRDFGGPESQGLLAWEGDSQPQARPASQTHRPAGSGCGAPGQRARSRPRSAPAPGPGSWLPASVPAALPGSLTSSGTARCWGPQRPVPEERGWP